jgi:predicted  nucleic acid-binding Zn-ribbon protein
MGEAAEKLVALALCEEALLGLERDRVRIPEQIAEQEKRLADSRAALEAERNALEEADQRRRTREGELQDLEVQRSKFQGQTALVKTNQEYTALLHEIDGATARIARLEDEILEAMEFVETTRDHLSGVEEAHARLESEIESSVADLKRELARVEREIVVRGSEEEELLARLDSRTRSSYERVKKGKGSGTARVRERVCSACYRDVPFETINRILAGETHSCGNCSRVLVVIEDA